MVIKGDVFYYSFFLFFFLGAVSCVPTQRKVSQENRELVDSLVMSVQDVDSLIQMQNNFEQQGLMIESMATLRQLGKKYRDAGNFAEALEVHNRALGQAELLQDTLSIVRVLNDMGTDYRRMDLLIPAIEFHLKALRISEQVSDTTYISKKNRVISLNGLANVYLSIGNLDRADSVLRMALAGEKELGSSLGQAINYANIGSIFEQRGAIDSARYYYRQSLTKNQEASSILGIGLCHTYFGSLYEREGDYERAITEYKYSYEIMSRTGDDWHMLNALLALADIYQMRGSTAQSIELLQKAQESAEALHSFSHLSEVYRIYYECYQQVGNYRKALENYLLFSKFADSIVDMKKINSIQNITLNIERARNEGNMAEQKRILEQERKNKIVGYVIAGILLLLVTGGILLGVYITRLRAKTYRQLQSLSKMREEFFTNITHEFRTPLTLINGLSEEIATNDHYPEELQAQGKLINRQGNMLLSLVNQLLDIAKVKSAVGNEDYRYGDIFAYIAMVVEVYQQYAQQKELTIENRIHGTWIADFVPNYIDKIIANLISNSIRYTPQGGTITITALREAEDILLLSVADTGIGIAKEDKARLFDPFFQVGSNNHTGSGIGLALVHQIVSSLNGSIEVESEVGQGTTFIVRLSMCPLSSTSRVLTQVSPSSSQFFFSQDLDYPADSLSSLENAMRILIIEDHADVARYIGSQLPSSYCIYYATDGQMGLDKAQNLIPDVVITDLMMPGLDGYQVCKEIRKNELTNHIPIIILTAKVTDSDRVKGYAAGADAYLSKPFQREELQTLVAQLVERRRIICNKYSVLGKRDSSVSSCEETLTDTERAIEASNTLFLQKISEVVFSLITSGSKTDVSTVATKLFMSESQLYRKLAAITDLSPAVYILQIKLSRAKQLMEQSAKITLTEVSELSGFADYSSFVRAFKKIYGETPSSCKQKMPPKEGN